MVNQGKMDKKKVAIIAMLLSQASRSPELTKIMILLLVWGNVRSRSGYTPVESQSPLKSPQQKSANKKMGFTVKQPRARFL
jgi:hypothetical protein